MIDVRYLLPSNSGFTGRYDLVLDRVTRRVWHHTVSNIDWNTAVNATVDQEVAHLLDIDRMHLAWGLNGFGYHNAAFASSRAYHVGSYDKARAHVASGQNSHSIGTVLIGNFTTALPSEGHMAAAQECKRDIERFYRRDLDGLPHVLVPGQNTVCPGSRWREWVPLLEKEEEEMSDQRIREIVKELLGYDPATPDNTVATDMAKVRMQALAANRVAGLALAGGDEAWREARSIMDFFGLGK